MKRTRFLAMLAMGCLLLWGQAARSQSLEEAREAYHTFLSRYNGGTSHSPETYDALMQAYQLYLALVEQGSGEEVANEGKQVLRDLRPYMQNGAVFYSQQQTPESQVVALSFARAYVDIPQMKIFRGEPFAQNSYYPRMVYFAASGCYNARDFQAAIRYFREYLATGAVERKRDILLYLVNAYQQVDDLPRASRVLAEAVNSYPDDFQLLSKAINVAIDTKDNEALQKYVAQAILLRPDDRALRNIQAKLYEDIGKYEEAAQCYVSLREENPQSLNYAQHLALNYYNLGVLYNNMSMEQSDPEAERRCIDQAAQYFMLAEPIVRDILSADPSSLQYLSIRATIERNFGRREELAETNRRIVALGGTPVRGNDIASLQVFGQSAPASPAAAQPAGGSVMLAGHTPTVDTFDPDGEAPLFSEYAKQYVESRISAWQKKDPYETLTEYRARVTEKTRKAKIQDLLLAAEANYVERYAKSVHLSDLKLQPYDADHESFLAESEYGPVIIPVPRANNEARIFESNWNGIRLTDPRFHIVDDKMVLSALTFITPTGKSYRYDDQNANTYVATTVNINTEPIDYSQFASENGSSTRPARSTRPVKIEPSDVDLNIPKTGVKSDKTFAVIIANENYETVAGVPMALNDGEIFSQYCEKTLGLPKKNIRVYKDATYGAMVRAVHDIKAISNAFNGGIKVIFYYAGHGIPNETTKDAFLLPVDADGLQTDDVCYSLNKLYAELGAMKAESVFVFLDACFSGAQRDSDSRMLASARGIALRANRERPQGNMVIFSAASGDETAFPYTEKSHGLFTYFLLKKLQETQGDVTLSELSDYVTEQVRQQAVVTNRKPQTPSVSASESMEEIWRDIRLVIKPEVDPAEEDPEGAEAAEAAESK